jgi:hypothetical protein
LINAANVMRMAGRPSIVPNGDDQTVDLVKDDLGRRDAVWRDADAEATNLKTSSPICSPVSYKDPIRVIAFSTAERWSQEVSEDVAHELRGRYDLLIRDLPEPIVDFERHGTGIQADSSPKP